MKKRVNLIPIKRMATTDEVVEQILIVIPSRFNSTRLPGKPLKKIGNKSMIEYVYLRAKKIGCAKVIVATDDDRIFKHCKENKINVMMTDKKHKSGTDRVAEISKQFNYKWILNIQGDEPLINIKDIKNLIKNTFKHNKIDKNFSVSTLYYLKKETYKNDLNEARLLINKKNEVIIFTRKRITLKSENNNYKKHIGVYFYKKNFLEKFSKLKKSFLENDQRLEQLRIIENGYKIIAFRAKKLSIGVDTKKELNLVRKLINHD
jgi:3-deoxy-manno-octulosonate cytidylyltransferase (CMP-KDO synthetase)